MIIKEIYTKYITALTPIYGDGEAKAITKILFEHALEIKNVITMLHSQNEVLKEEENYLLKALQQLKNHEPLQYIIGQAWFYNLLFTVNKHVLIPRSETEELVLETIQYLQKNNAKTVLDIGTGSGCIPISIKKNTQNVDVFSVDVSQVAIEVAAQNALANNVAIHFICADFLEENNYNNLPIVDVIISNPPYIPANDITTMAEHVTQHEPHLALFVPEHDPLLFYKKIETFATTNLNPNGKIFLEIHEDFALQTAAVFSQKKYAVSIKKDMQGKDRMLLITHCP